MFRLLQRFAFSRERPPRERALKALRRRDYATAEAGLTALLESETNALERAFLSNKRGVARIGMGRPLDARADFEAALSSVATYAPALTNIGNLALEAGDLATATQMYEAALRADPDYAIACLNLGVAYKRSGRVGEGVRLLRRAQQLERPRFVRRFRL
jgi:tetratricopeptide (TPR) repeat protein